MSTIQPEAAPTDVIKSVVVHRADRLRPPAVHWFTVDMMIAQGVLGALLLTAVVCVVVPRRWNAILLAVWSAAWLPANNTHLEGRVLLVVDHHHGLTTADLISYVGFLLAALTMLRWSRAGRPGRTAGAPIVGMVALAGASMTATWIFQPY